MGNRNLSNYSVGAAPKFDCFFTPILGLGVHIFSYWLNSFSTGSIYLTIEWDEVGDDLSPETGSVES